MGAGMMRRDDVALNPASAGLFSVRSSRGFDCLDLRRQGAPYDSASSARTCAFIDSRMPQGPSPGREKVSIGCPSQRSTDPLSNKNPLRS
jgi:hypothetical protein